MSHQLPEEKKNLRNVGRRRSFLSDKQRKTLDDIVAMLNLEAEQKVPCDHPLKALLDANAHNQEMSVKEVLAKKYFPEYRVRLNKRHISAGSPVNKKKPRTTNDIRFDLQAVGYQLVEARLNPCREVDGGRCKVPAEGNNSLPSPTGVLTAVEELLVVVQSKTQTSVEILAGNFNVSKRVVEEVLSSKDRVLEKSSRILIESILQNARPEKRGHSISRRRGGFFGVNVLAWKLFEECANYGVQLTPKIIREHALHFSRQLGMTLFKGSDGWYDCFKRRHQIDLITMTGFSNISQGDEDDLLYEMRELLKVLEEEEEDRAKQAADNNEDDIGEEPAASEHAPPLFDFPEPDVVENNDEDDDEPYDLPAIHEDPVNADLLVRSVSIYIPDPEVSYYIGILRTFIVTRNPGLLPHLVQIQELIAQVLYALCPQVRNSNVAPQVGNSFQPQVPPNRQH